MLFITITFIRLPSLIFGKKLSIMLSNDYDHFLKFVYELKIVLKFHCSAVLKLIY